ncbi:MAG TPA: SDR family oxidoreductase [Steroidobacteraceae bacterium]
MTRPAAVITGASSGIGAGFARALAATHDLLLVARRRDRLDALAAELTARGSVVDVLGADLADEGGLIAVADRIAAQTSLDLLVNSAGFGLRGLFWETDLEAQQRMHRLHVLATVRLSHAALRNMTARGSGSLINVASVAAFMHRPGSVSYGATKSWMTAFTETLYLELKSIGSAVKVQALCPGFTYSEFHDVMRVDRRMLGSPSLWLRADQVVDASLKGLSTGTLFVVPGWRYRLLVALLTKLPASLRLALESAAGTKRSRRSAP